MKFPVVIAAHNEESMIGRTLDALDSSRFEPLVVANGCEDRTALVAKEYGAEVIERHEAGKLPAIQEALRSLGARALGPVFYTDADSYPLSNRYWSRLMVDALRPDRPHVISGPIIHADGANLGDDLLRSIKRQVDIRRAKRVGLTHCFGANIVSRFDTPELLDAVLTLPHIWPGEDRAMEELVVEHGGDKVQVTDVRASVVTSSRYLPTVAHVLKVGKKQAREEVLARYDERAAPDSITYGRYARRRRRLGETNQ